MKARHAEQVGKALGTIHRSGKARPMLLHNLAYEILQNNVDKGWRPDDKKTFVEELMLIVTEVSEACDAYRAHGFDDATLVTVCPSGDTDCTTDCGMCKGQPPKPEGVGSELADVLIRLLDTAYWWGIDLAAETERKMAYNRTRSYRHGGKKL